MKLLRRRFGRFTLIGYVVALAVGLGVILGYGAMHMSSTPGFCGSCHLMAPYYDSWVESSHNSIACVDCHIPPGITAELEKKYEAMAMVARYFTGTYGTRPWAEIDDAACLTCHERRLLVGRELFGDVLFDHAPHLTEMRRGKRLRCTSCHSQIVQGSHIAVTATTCTLCHFKGQEPGAGTARCELCHQVPERIVDASGLAFDHGDVSRFGMECQLCHTPPDPTAGGVPRERCVTCHSDPRRLAEFGKVDFLHQTHVTDHKVECTHCHLEIEHVVPRHFDTAKSECDACHGGGHAPQRELYAGLGGQGVPPMPDVMYRAGVRCEGCHLDHGDGQTRTADDVSCMSCHGPKYRDLFASWSRSVGSRTAALRREFDATDRQLGSNAPAVFADARTNLELVERGKGIHNFPYSLKLLAVAHDQINQAREETGLGPVVAPWPQAPFQSACLECHAGMEAQTVQVFGRRFPHQRHVVGAGLECQTCHTTHEERAEKGASPIKIDVGSCESCHHGQVERECTICHGGILQQAVDSDLGDFEHRLHIEDMGIACVDCHGEAPALIAEPDLEVCSECH